MSRKFSTPRATLPSNRSAPLFAPPRRLRRTPWRQGAAERGTTHMAPTRVLVENEWALRSVSLSDPRSVFNGGIHERFLTAQSPLAVNLYERWLAMSAEFAKKSPQSTSVCSRGSSAFPGIRTPSEHARLDRRSAPLATTPIAPSRATPAKISADL